MKSTRSCPALALAIFVFAVTTAIRGDGGSIDTRSYPERPQMLLPVPSPTVPWIQETAMPAPSSKLVKRSGVISPAEAITPLPTQMPVLSGGSSQCQVIEGLAEEVAAATSCVGRYSNSLATTVSGARGVLPTPTAIITKQGTLLKAGAKTYRPVGPNIYWLGLDENVGNMVSYPSRTRIREAFAIAAAMGANTVRSISLGVSTGHPLSIWPTKGETNQDAFESIDYAIATARHYGIRLIIPFTDNYRYYHGGKYDFLAWEGLDDGDVDADGLFYTNTDVIDSFKAYIQVYLNHVNQFNGIAIKDDPTILAWETGNELGAFELEEGAPPGEWTREIATYIKSIDSNHLVIDGSDGVVDSNGDPIDGLDVNEVDIISDHFYPLNNFTFWQSHSLTTPSNKAYIVGEYDWTGANGGEVLSSFYNEILKTREVGDIAWSVMTHDDQCCQYVTHDDGYSIYYPNGNANQLQSRILRVVQHWYHMTGRDSPHVLPAVACPQPEWLSS